MPQGLIDVSHTVCSLPWHPFLLLESEPQHFKAAGQLPEESPTNHHAHRQQSTRHVEQIRCRVQEAIQGCNSAFECEITGDQSKATHNASQALSVLSPSAPGTLSPESEDEPHQKDITTVMIRNIPYTYTLIDLKNEIDQLGFTGLYDLLHLPLKGTKNVQNVGYAFINLVSVEAAAGFQHTMRRYRFKLHPNNGFNKVATVSAARRQGLYANMGSNPTCSLMVSL